MNSPILRDCGSKVCKLRMIEIPPLRRIKLHCIDCVPEQTIYGVRACTGKLLDGAMCPLHPYRMGKNPKLKGKRGKGNPEALKLAREVKNQRALKRQISLNEGQDIV